MTGGDKVRIRLGVLVAGMLACALALPPTRVAYAAGKEGLPRQVTPRGELGAEERATIDLFERARDSVVFITKRRCWTRCCNPAAS